MPKVQSEIRWKIKVLEKNGGWYLLLLARNGRVVACSAKYTSKSMALRTAEMLQKDLFMSKLIIHTSMKISIKRLNDI